MTIAHPLLSRRPSPHVPSVALLPNTQEMGLIQGRVHEATGPARRSFAIWLAARLDGPVFWIAPPWMQERLNCDGLCPWIDPARIIFVSPKRAEDLLWTMEEVLRAGATALSIADLSGLPTLTQVRRMHLAAETGGQAGTHLPLGLLLTPGQGGAAGVETRWHLAPRHVSSQDRWRLNRVRARTSPRKSWEIERTAHTESLQIKTM